MQWPSGDYYDHVPEIILQIPIRHQCLPRLSFPHSSFCILPSAASLISLRPSCHPVIFFLKVSQWISVNWIKAKPKVHLIPCECTLVCLLLGQGGHGSRYIFSDMSSCLSSGFTFLAKIPKSEVMTFSKHQVRRDMMSICSITENGDFDPLVRVRSVRLLCCKVTVFHCI